MHSMLNCDNDDDDGDDDCNDDANDCDKIFIIVHYKCGINKQKITEKGRAKKNTRGHIRRQSCQMQGTELPTNSG